MKNKILVFEILKFKIKITTNSVGLSAGIAYRYRNFVKVIEEDSKMSYDGVINITEDSLVNYIDKSKFPFVGDTSNVEFRSFYYGNLDLKRYVCNYIIEKQNSAHLFEVIIQNYFLVFFLSHDIVMMHCSALYDKNNNVYIFYGGSGAGKSTLTSNRKDLRVISEDFVLIQKSSRLDSDTFIISRTPFFRDKGLFDCKTEYKIKGFYYLIQSKNEKILQMDKNVGLHYLSANSGIMRGYENLFIKLVSLYHNYFNTVPFYSLYFKKESIPDFLIQD